MYICTYLYLQGHRAAFAAENVCLFHFYFSILNTNNPEENKVGSLSNLSLSTGKEEVICSKNLDATQTSKPANMKTKNPEEKKVGTLSNLSLSTRKQEGICSKNLDAIETSKPENLKTDNQEEKKVDSLSNLSLSTRKEKDAIETSQPARNDDDVDTAVRFE